MISYRRSTSASYGTIRSNGLTSSCSSISEARSREERRRSEVLSTYLRPVKLTQVSRFVRRMLPRNQSRRDHSLGCRDVLFLVVEEYVCSGGFKDRRFFRKPN